MHRGTGIAGATLLYGEHQGEPDLLLAMQTLLDDLRGDGRRVSGVKLAGASLRLRADPFEIVLTLASGPLPPGALHGLTRPLAHEGPDFARVHLSRMLRVHRQALGFLIRRRGAPLPDAAAALQQLTREGQLCLLSVFEAALPALVVWHPGGLVLTAEEFRAASPTLLLSPGDASAPLSVTRPERQGMARPDAAGLFPLVAADDTPASDPVGPSPRSIGRLFAADPPPTLSRATPVAGIERASDRVTLALRGTASSARTPRSTPRLLARLSLAAMLPWLGWLGGSLP